MKEFKWVWISYFCLIACIMILLWIDKTISAHAQSGGYEISEEELEEETFQTVQMELESRSWPGLYYFTSNGWQKYGTPWEKVGDHYFCSK